MAAKSLQDQLQKKAVQQAAAAIKNRLVEFTTPNKTRAIRDLNSGHLDVLASDAITAYLAERARQAEDNPDIFDELCTGVKNPGAPFNDSIDDLFV